MGSPIIMAAPLHLRTCLAGHVVTAIDTIDTRSAAPGNIFHVLRPLSSYPHGVMVIQLSMGSESLRVPVS